MSQSESRANEEVTAATVETPVATNEEAKHEEAKHEEAEPKEAEPKEAEPKEAEHEEAKHEEVKHDETEPKEAEPKEPVQEEADKPALTVDTEEPVSADEVAVVTFDDPVEEAKEKIGDALENVGEELFGTVMDKVKAKSEEIGLQPSTLPRIIGLVMEAIEETPVKGEDQLKFAVKVIDVLITELPDGSAKTLLQETSASGGIAGTIELVVLASRGELNVNVVLENAGSCITPCCNFFTRKLKRRRQ